MKVLQTRCDECKELGDEINVAKWFRVGVLSFSDSKEKQILMGRLPEKELPNFEVHDICGERCLHRHIDKLLGLTPTPTPPPIPSSTASVVSKVEVIDVQYPIQEPLGL